MSTKDLLLKLVEEIDPKSLNTNQITEWITKIAQYRVYLGGDQSKLKIDWSKSFQDTKMQGLTEGEAKATANVDCPDLPSLNMLLDTTLEVMNALKVQRLDLAEEKKYLNHS